MKLHKAISIIQFKLEGQLVQKYPWFQADDRRVLEKINYEEGTIEIDGTVYQLLDSNFPTVDPKDPYALSEAEQNVMERLVGAFENCDRLQQHMLLLLNKGSMYKVFNNNLLYHGCVLLDENGEFQKVEIFGKTYSGKALYDVLESYVRKAYFEVDEEERERGRDIMWFIWASRNSPLFGKERMTTFERYFVEDSAVHKEKKNPYYRFLNDEQVMNRILKEFGLSEDSHIVNGHVPVLQISGESPVKCNGKVLVIDGGFSKAYQAKTGIAGYTLIYNSYGMMLVAHEPFSSMEDAIEKETDIHSDRIMVKMAPRRMLVGDSDTGRELEERIGELMQLLAAYRSGQIIEK